MTVVERFLDPIPFSPVILHEELINADWERKIRIRRGERGDAVSLPFWRGVGDA